jgi:DnaJ homolog subfamily C member 2
MAGEKDDGIPWVKFPPKPEGWKGDPGNPNFKTLGTLSPPIMRQIEPAGPHFLAFARRVSHFESNSSMPRLQILETPWPHFLRR